MNLNFSAQEIRPNVYHFSFDTQYYLTSSMMRVQEYYESPFKGIRGEFFKTEQYMDMYANHKNDREFSYFTDWSGFNIPGNVLLAFYEKFKYDLLLKEKNLFDLILLFRHEEKIFKNKNQFYVIATFKGKEEMSAIRHELSHAYWYLHKKLYADASRELLKDKRSIEPKALYTIKKSLLDMGYCEEVLDDEAQAYLCSSTRSFITQRLGAPEKSKISIGFKKLFDSFDSVQVSKLSKNAPKYAEQKT